MVWLTCQCSRDVIHFCRVTFRSLEIRTYFVSHYSLPCSTVWTWLTLSIQLKMYVSFPSVFKNWWCIILWWSLLWLSLFHSCSPELNAAYCLLRFLPNFILHPVWYYIVNYFSCRRRGEIFLLWIILSFV